MAGAGSAALGTMTADDEVRMRSRNGNLCAHPRPASDLWYWHQWIVTAILWGDGAAVGFGMKTHRVRLTADERRVLEALVTKGRAAARQLTRARILLKADEAPDGPAWADTAVAAAVEVSVATIQRVRPRFVEHGLDDAIRQRRPRREHRTRLAGEQEAHLVALAYSPAAAQETALDTAAAG